jgi:GNAT superfamily N-acetyltransferase
LKKRLSVAIRTAVADADVLRCFPVLRQLRTHVVEAQFLERVRRQQAQAGYTLVYLEDRGEVKAVAGFRIAESLFDGRYLYVDDLVTAEADRGRGYGKRLFHWLVKRARARQCSALTLDSGVQRFEAHRFYLAQGLDITSHHFSLRLP